MIGKRRVPPDYVLRDGDVVKVVRQETPVRFDQDIQRLCQTPRARSELAKGFRLRRQEVSREIGASVFRQEMRRYGMPFEVIEKKGMIDILTYFHLDSLDDLFLQIGEGRVRLRELIYEVRNGLYVGRETLQLPTGVFNRIELATVDPVVVKSSACCKPTPLDKGVIGLLSERGLSLHKKDCARLRKIKFQREEAVEVRWKLRGTRVTKVQKIIVMAATRHRMFMLLSVAPDEMKISEIISLGRQTVAPSAWEISFTVVDLYDLKKICKHFDRSGLPYEFDFEP
jgi:GTP pyrophosphokinase